MRVREFPIVGMDPASIGPFNFEVIVSVACAAIIGAASRPVRIARSIIVRVATSNAVDVPAALISWSSTKIRRVVRSTLAAEASAFATGYDTAIWIRAMISSILSPDDTRHWSERIYDVP